MHGPTRLLLGMALAAASASPAWAEEDRAPWANERASMTVNGTTIWAGGGAQWLSLPDINFTFLVDSVTQAAVRTQKNSDLKDYGGVVTGGIETLLGYRGNTPVTGIVSGFFANVEDTDRTQCATNSNYECFAQDIVDNPDVGDGYFFNRMNTTAHRDVDYWGAGAELRFGKAPAPVPDRGGYLFRLAYVGVGADVRGIDQDNKLRMRGTLLSGVEAPGVDYSETLDTTYAGAFLSLGGEYNILGYLGIGKSWGIRSLLSLKAGLYNASTDYDGHFRAVDADTRLGLSEDEVAFIGSASFETRKQFGQRTSLSLVTDYEYYSYAPEMRYVNADRVPNFLYPGTVNRTHIDDDDAFSVRTTLRLNIGLGSAPLYADPVK